MSGIYLEYNFIIKPRDPASEILIAELGYSGFESFVETELGFKAYIQKQDWDVSQLKEIPLLNASDFDIQFSSKEIEQVNWNEEWEKNFDPIVVDDKVSIRAPFHKNPHVPYDIVIEPKMSFGTGHHETTYMMVQQMLAMDFNEKSVLDMGCGTGILAIFAEMRGARHIDAIDIDSWCYENTLENAARNNCKQIDVFEGDASLLNDKSYEIILANINRNILMKDMRAYKIALEKGGQIAFSGFYKEDIVFLNHMAKSLDLKLVRTLERNNWYSLLYQS